MERGVAVKKLRNMLGKNFGYQIDPKAPSEDERKLARAQSQERVTVRNEIGERLRARREAILNADPEYQRLTVEYADARKRCDEVTSMLHHYKFCVGTSNGMFFRVAAQGDSWEDVIAEVKRKKEAKQLF